MSQPIVGSTDAQEQGREEGSKTGKSRTSIKRPIGGGELFPRSPVFNWGQQNAPPLHVPAAQPLARDRWERLVTAIEIPEDVEKVWEALINPDALKLWLATCHGSLEDLSRDCMLDFDDGEFFLCRPATVTPPNYLHYFWRWLGIGQATSVEWELKPTETGTRVLVKEEAQNPPWDWQTWNGGGWPGILDQLAAYLRTGTEWRWPWRRMGPYAQVELPLSVYEAWDRLLNPASLKYWLLATQGSIEEGQSLPIFMGDASGAVEMIVHQVTLPGQSPPSFLPSVNFSFKRPVWGCEVGGRLWIEPAGWGRCLFQVFHTNWENVPAALQLSERRIVTSFWSGAMRRAIQVCGVSSLPTESHNWS